MAYAAQFRQRVSRVLSRLGFPTDWYLIPLAALIGVLGGLVAVGFDFLVRYSSHLFFSGVWEQGRATQYVLIALIPAVGGLLVGLLQNVLTPAGKGPGVAEVMEALARRHGHISGITGVKKAITSSITLGSGGSGGVEGPIIQIGSALGSTVARLLHVGREHVHTLVGCGAAAGMAGIFNAPIASVLFVLEVLLRDFSFRTFIPIVVASVFGTAVAQAVLGANTTIFNVPETMTEYQFVLWEIAPYLLLGVLCGLVASLFILFMGTGSRVWEKIRVPSWSKPALGGLAVGVLGVVFAMSFPKPVATYDPPAFFSNGYPVAEALLNPASYVPGGREAEAEPSGLGERAVEAFEDVAKSMTQPAPPVSNAGVGLLFGLVVFKMVATWLTIGSGGSAGIFAPSLFIGAALGGGFAMGLDQMGLFPGTTPASYAMAGMAGMIAAVVHAPLTAFLLVFEITQDYKVILPFMLVAIIATAISQFLAKDSFYSAWLRQRGIRVGRHSDMTLLRRLTVDDVPLTPAVIVHVEEPAQRLIELAEDYAVTDYVVCDDDDHCLGMVVGEDVRTTLVQRDAIPLMIVEELMRSGLPTVTRDETLDVVLDKFSKHDVASLPVVDAG
ncbi:MAG: chloride channel protein [Phycisphaeraceae bacterium]